jgi:predicted nucleic acid-binding protein
MRTYVDSSPVIYAVQRVPPYFAAVDARLAAPGVVIVSSELTRMECLVLPLRNADGRVVADFDAFFATQVSQMVPFSPAVFRRAAEIRAQFNFRTPDVLHLAAAVEGGCDVFLTNDAQLTRFTGLTVEVV